MVKNAKEAGADERTPSVPQYFSWINNTNEGSTEKQTLINLEFFRYLKDTYGMEIKIYAWDAGNFDGASEGYGNLAGEKFRSQYPKGYKNIVKRAGELGIRMGLWGSPDGYGDDPATEKERFDFFVHLCKDYGFAEFKLDGVCGHLRPEKAPLFAKMLEECRRYSPDLIVLNHRLDMYEAEKNVTTFLWNGQETYVDVLIHNNVTAMHNRAYMFSRGHVDGLQRLSEDHGVCVSSGIDYFEDELVYQAFNRSLILAPELYGNPWFMRDDELPKLARVYNLHRRNAPVLVDGMLLGEAYGCEACSRGSDTKRFISTGNDTWETKKITVTLNESIGLKNCARVAVNQHHPFERHIGIFSYGESVEIELLPFRAALIEVSDVNEAEPMLTGCDYEMIKEDKNGVPEEVKVLTCENEDIYLLNKGERSFFMPACRVDIKEKPPVFVGELDEIVHDPENGEELYETAMFAVNNDALEVRSMERSGKTSIPEVQTCRDAFFAQTTYKLRGCEAKNMFDGDPDTFFDSQSKTYVNGFRINGGCLRIDAGEELDADSVEIEFFSADVPTNEVSLQNISARAEISSDLKSWRTSGAVNVSVAKSDFTMQTVKFKVHTIYDVKGELLKAVYPIKGKMRYLRLIQPMDRIFAVKFMKDGKEIKLTYPKANNLQSHPQYNRMQLLMSGEILLPDYKTGSRIAVAINGYHGDEGVFCVAEINGEKRGFTSRAPDYKANVWEHTVCRCDRNYTYFLPLEDGLAGKKIKLHAVFNGDYTDCPGELNCKVYICEKH